MKQAVIVSAVRTPIGKMGGGLAAVPAHVVAAATIREAAKRARIQPESVDEVVYGNLYAVQYQNIARVAALEAGLPISVPGITLNRACGSGLNAVAYGAILIEAGYHRVVVAGGVECDSTRPWAMEKPTEAFQFRPPAWITRKTVPPSCGDASMMDTAENLARKYHLSRQECDEFSLASHQKAAKAWEAGYFNSQIIPVDVDLGKGKKATVVQDEVVRKDASLEALAKLKVASGHADGVVTAGNSSPLSDGGGSVVLMEKEMAVSMGLEILGTFRGYASVGVDPDIMGIGPVYAIRKLMADKGMQLDDVDIIEMNEAFAAQSLPCVRELHMDMGKLNVNGGAIALGHPLGGTGAILTIKTVYELERRQARFGLIAFCCGGGQGVAMLVEREP
jgi:acetyl-CoA acetyltransferase family protein